ncbi:MAG: hypothetical protein KAR20_10680 [Candidatus Heimdallarchaeota archaeon]|nr:hypothetical protein [Candidatus Heimdallarchaeota archaeon]
MEEQVVEPRGISKKEPNCILTIITTSLIILTIIILAMYFFLPESPSPPQLNRTTSLQTKIQECAILTPNQECILLYSTPDIEAKCDQLEELKDQCLYNFAVINERFDICNRIQDTILKNKCQEEITNFFVSEE